MNIKDLKKKSQTWLLRCSAIAAPLLLGGAGSALFSSCSDMLEVDSDRQVFDPSLDSKTDSIYYILGALQGLQQAADQYVLVNELRGDLLAPTQYADSALTQLYNYTATASNKYDSAYVYYRVINNCNYYVANRDTTLRTGSRQVAIPEYAEALAIRAWCYLQLTRTYGKVPYFTNVVDNISEADGIFARTAEYKGIEEITTDLETEMKKFVDTPVPYYGNIDANNGKTVNSQLIMFPTLLVLGDLYLESGRYADAAQCYANYLLKYNLSSLRRIASYTEWWLKSDIQSTDLPEDFQTGRGVVDSDPDVSGTTWSANYDLNPVINAGNNRVGDLISYIPLAVNKLQGTISKLPDMFGYNQFSKFNTDDPQQYYEDYQLTGSSEYQRIVRAQDYHYQTYDTYLMEVFRSAPIGDMRYWASLSGQLPGKVNTGDTYQIFTKFNNANVLIYRTSMIYLRLAECLNRMGYPDAAFAILKNGLGSSLLNIHNSTTTTINYEKDENGDIVLDEDGKPIAIDTVVTRNTYLEDKTWELLNTELPFFTEKPVRRAVLGAATGIHSHGCGYTSNLNSLYQYQTEVSKKAAELNERYGLSLPDSIEVYTEAGKKQAIEIVEDLICDEYALEAAFEGHRYGDLLRLARNKNQGASSDKPFGDNWGGRWLNGKLAFKKAFGINVPDFTDQSNWYLPLSNKK